MEILWTRMDEKGLKTPQKLTHHKGLTKSSLKMRWVSKWQRITIL
jgi:hypothetical protein